MGGSKSATRVRVCNVEQACVCARAKCGLHHDGNTCPTCIREGECAVVHKMRGPLYKRQRQNQVASQRVSVEFCGTRQHSKTNDWPNQSFRSMSIVLKVLKYFKRMYRSKPAETIINFHQLHRHRHQRDYCSLLSTWQRVLLLLSVLLLVLLWLLLFLVRLWVEWHDDVQGMCCFSCPPKFCGT